MALPLCETRCKDCRAFYLKRNYYNWVTRDNVMMGLCTNPMGPDGEINGDNTTKENLLIGIGSD